MDTLLTQHSDFVPALKLRGMLLGDMGREAEAAQSYESALKLAPGDSEMLLKVGVIELLTGHVEGARSMLERRVRAVPSDGEGNYYLAQAYHLNGQNDRALTAIRIALKADPESGPIQQKYGELLCSSGQNDEALKWLQKARATDPSLHRINFDLAVASFGSMDLDAAADYANREAALQPGDLEDRRLLAAVEIKLSQWEQAEANLRRVLAVKGEDAVATLDLGHCEMELKDYPASIEILNRALQLDPTLVLAHFYLARAYGALGNADAAQHEAALHREMMQHRSFTSTKSEAKREQALINHVRELLASNHEAEAVAVLQQGQQGPGATRGGAWVSIGATYVAMSRSEDAERSLRRALELDPRTRDAHTYIGYLLLEQGNLSGAETNFQAELALDPNNAPALGELGEVRYRQQRWSDAVDMLVRSKTTNLLLLYMLCDAYFRLGKPAQAQLTAESLSAYGRGEPTVLKALDDLLKRNGQGALAERLAHAS